MKHPKRTCGERCVAVWDVTRAIGIALLSASGWSVEVAYDRHAVSLEIVLWLTL
jgi:hypothetical protein